MQQLKPPTVRQQQQQKSHVSADLSTCTFVFVQSEVTPLPEETSRTRMTPRIAKSGCRVH